MTFRLGSFWPDLGWVVSANFDGSFWPDIPPPPPPIFYNLNGTAHNDKFSVITYMSYNTSLCSAAVSKGSYRVEKDLFRIEPLLLINAKKLNGPK